MKSVLPWSLQLRIEAEIFKNSTDRGSNKQNIKWSIFETCQVFSNFGHTQFSLAITLLTKTTRLNFIGPYCHVTFSELNSDWFIFWFRCYAYGHKRSGRRNKRHKRPNIIDFFKSGIKYSLVYKLRRLHT